jgi:aryl-alcohol dehydrogenase-like predicted oxidoreductase
VGMQYRRLGRSGLEVSPICLGAMMFGDRTDAAAAASIVDAALDAGINFIDTADKYAEGESERIVGASIQRHRRRWILATKVGNPMTAKPHDGGSSRRWILQACDDSLGRLRTDYIDIYYLHKDDRATPLEETVRAIGDLVRAGKIRYFGISNFRGWRIAEVMRLCTQLNVAPPVVCQPHYNLLNRVAEVEVLPACEHYGIGVAPYSPIARGVLSGKYIPGQTPPEGSRARRGDQRMMQTEYREESLRIAQRLHEHAQATGRTLPHFALAWLWANRVVTSVIVGPRTMEQWQTYVSALGTAWSKEDEKLVDSLVVAGHPSTPGFNDPSYPIEGRAVG